jgi:hypothetical protein
MNEWMRVSWNGLFDNADGVGYMNNQGKWFSIRDFASSSLRNSVCSLRRSRLLRDVFPEIVRSSWREVYLEETYARQRYPMQQNPSYIEIQEHLNWQVSTQHSYRQLNTKHISTMECSFANGAILSERWGSRGVTAGKTTGAHMECKYAQEILYMKSGYINMTRINCLIWEACHWAI